MIRYLIDADASIYAMDPERRDPVAARISQSELGTIAVSAVTFAEIMVGTTAGKPPPPSVLEAFVSQIPIVPFDEEAARAYATMPFKRARFDRLLAAHALSLGATVITNNEGDFADVPGLTTENWTLPL